MADEIRGGAYPAQRRVFLDAVRILACILVVMNHTAGYVINTGAPGEKLFFSFFFSLSKAGVPLFLMLSGTLLLDRDYGPRKILQCMLRILLPLLAISAFLAWKDEGTAGLRPGRFLSQFIAEPRRAAYWYLYALLGFYAMLPFLQKMVRSFRLSDYAAFTGLFLLLPCLVTMLQLYGGPKFGPYLRLSTVPRFLAIAVAGAFVGHLPASRRGGRLSLLLFFLAWGGLFASFYVPYLRHGELSYLLDSWDQLPAVVMAGSLLYAFRAFGCGEALGARGRRILSEIAGTAFGVYLFHPVLEHRVFLQGPIQTLFLKNACPGTALFTLCLILVCGLLSFLLRRIPVIRRFL